MARMTWSVIGRSIRSNSSEPNSRRMTREPIGVVRMTPIDCRTCSKSDRTEPVSRLKPADAISAGLLLGRSGGPLCLRQRELVAIGRQELPRHDVGHIDALRRSRMPGASKKAGRIDDDLHHAPPSFGW